MMTSLFCVTYSEECDTEGKRRKVATNLIKQTEFLIQQHLDDYKEACKVHRSDGSAKTTASRARVSKLSFLNKPNRKPA